MKTNEEILELLKECKSEEEVIKVLKDNGIELQEEDLKIVCGGLPEGGINDIIKTIVVNGK